MPKVSALQFKTAAPSLAVVQLAPSYAGPYEQDDPEEHWTICGYTDEAETRKTAFLHDAARWWRAVAQVLATVGYTEYHIHSNRSGISCSGDVRAEFRNPAVERWIVAWIETIHGSMADHRAAIALNAHVWGKDPPRAPDYDTEAEAHPRPDHLAVMARWKGPPPRPNYSPAEGGNVYLPAFNSVVMAAALLREIAREPTLADQVLAAWRAEQERAEQRSQQRSRRGASRVQAKGAAPTLPPAPSRVVQMTLI